MKENSNIKLKNAVDRILFRKKVVDEDPPTRKYLMHQFKNIILTNKQLNHRFMDFNFTKEYKQLHKTMTKFNNEQNSKKNLVLKLSKENSFFTKSYPNIIASLAIKLDKKNVNCQTISNFNEKYKSTSSSPKNNNFFYEDPLLLTKSKDLDNFYENENNANANEDESLNYSKKLLLGLNSNSPLNRVLQIIEKKRLKIDREKLFEKKENLSERNKKNNNKIFNNENQQFSERNKNYHFYYNKLTDINEKEEIKKLKKYNSSIKRILNENKSMGRTFTVKNIDRAQLKSILINNNNNLKSDNGKVITDYNNERNKKNVKFNTILSGKNLIRQISRQLDSITPSKRYMLKMKEKEREMMVKELEKILPKQNKMYKTIKKKLGKMNKLKGSIQIRNIYKDLVKTKVTVNSYEKEKEPKLKYLYSIYNNKKVVPFQKEQSENIKIKKLDHDLFWTVNQFHVNN